MKKGKDISTLFREGERNLRAQPSLNAWNRLEGRLNNQKRSGNIVPMYRWMLAVAACLALVVSVYFWSGSSNGNNSMGIDNPAPASMEELINNDGCQPYCMTLEALKELPAFYVVPGRNS